MRAHGMMALALLMIGASSAVTADAQETVNSPTAIHEQTAKHFQEVVQVLNRLGVPETPFDYIAPAVSGPVVVLQGFTANGGLKDDAESQVKKIKWVTHVVNEIDYLKSGSELRRTREQTLGILERLVPQAFSENHANIRIKVTLKGNITLVGVVDPQDKKRFEAAIEQIRHLDFVGSVTNDVVEKTS